MLQRGSTLVLLLQYKMSRTLLLLLVLWMLLQIRLHSQMQLVQSLLQRGACRWLRWQFRVELARAIVQQVTALSIAASSSTIRAVGHRVIGQGHQIVLVQVARVLDLLEESAQLLEGHIAKGLGTRIDGRRKQFSRLLGSGNKANIISCFRATSLSLHAAGEKRKLCF